MSISPSLHSALAALATGAFASLLLVTSHGTAVAVIASPPTAVCTGKCEACLESEQTPTGPRCLKCGVDPKCLGSDPGQASDQTTMLKAQNAYRAKHGTPALTWSADLAKGAQDWASACTPDPKNPDRFSHSPNAFSSYGENLYWGSGAGFTGAEAAAKSWYDESKNYNYSDPLTSYNAGDKDSSKEVRHFTQLIWRDTKELGCGAATCGKYQFWVCRYLPQGNWNAQNDGVLANNVPPVGGVQKTESTGGGIKPQNVPISPQTTSIAPPGPGKWSAFATDAKGHWGYAAHYATEADALTLAVNGCGGYGIGCKTFWTTEDKCVAYAESRQGGYWYAAGGGNSEQQARENAIKFCQSGTAPPNSCNSPMAKCQ